MNILGIDPGADGGMAVLTPGHELTVYKFKDKTLHDLSRMAFTEGLEACTAFIEKVHGMPGCGGQFNFGLKVGWLQGVMAAYNIPFEQVPPQTWMRGVGMAGLKMAKADRKKALRAKAQQLFPRTDISLSVADAVLIAEYGWRIVHGHKD